ncbi:MAG: hypothetical protein ACREEB_13360 [Caulobacteraceae bacterium]
MSERKYATEEDIALVKRTEVEIRSGVSVISFDVGALKRRVRDDDAAQAFIHAHLYIDHVVTQMVSEAVPFPRHLQLDRAGFTQKLQLVAALGLLSPSFLAPIRVINAIRNKIAHKLDYVVTPDDETKLRSAIPKGAGRAEDGSLTPLPELLRLVTVIIDLQRQERAFERTMRRRAVANARVVLDDIQVE